MIKPLDNRHPFLKKILFIDDNQDLHEVMRRLLTHMGYDSISAGSAKEGLQKAVSETPDLILLDIGLPDMDGRDAARLSYDPIRQANIFRSSPLLQYLISHSAKAAWKRAVTIML